MVSDTEVKEEGEGDTVSSNSDIPVNVVQSSELPEQTVTTRTQFYEDLKHGLKILGYIVCFLLVSWFFWSLFGWYFYIAVLIWILPVWFFFPYIAEKFMSYVYLLNIQLEPSMKVTLDAYPYERFAAAQIVDCNGEPSELNNAFVTREGLAYVVDSVKVDHDEETMETVDVVEVNILHGNAEFVSRYKPSFLAMRRELKAALTELWTLKTFWKIEADKTTLERTHSLIEYWGKQVFGVTSKQSQTERNTADIIDLKEKLGLGAYEKALEKNKEKEAV